MKNSNINQRKNNHLKEWLSDKLLGKNMMNWGVLELAENLQDKKTPKN